MYIQTFVVNNECGLHHKAAICFTQTAAKFKSRILVKKRYGHGGRQEFAGGFAS